MKAKSKIFLRIMEGLLTSDMLGEGMNITNLFITPRPSMMPRQLYNEG